MAHGITGTKKARGFASSNMNFIYVSVLTPEKHICQVTVSCFVSACCLRSAFYNVGLSLCLLNIFASHEKSILFLHVVPDLWFRLLQFWLERFQSSPQDWSDNSSFSLGLNFTVPLLATNSGCILCLVEGPNLTLPNICKVVYLDSLFTCGTFLLPDDGKHAVRCP